MEKGGHLLPQRFCVLQTWQRAAYGAPCLESKVRTRGRIRFSQVDLPPVDLRAVCLVRAMDKIEDKRQINAMWKEERMSESEVKGRGCIYSVGRVSHVLSTTRWIESINKAQPQPPFNPFISTRVPPDF